MKGRISGCCFVNPARRDKIHISNVPEPPRWNRIKEQMHAVHWQSVRVAARRSTFWVRCIGPALATQSDQDRKGTNSLERNVETHSDRPCNTDSSARARASSGPGSNV